MIMHLKGKNLKRNKIQVPSLELLSAEEEPPKSNDLNISLDLDYSYLPSTMRYVENQNLALQEVQTRQEMPNRDELIFLTDTEYERMLKLHSSLHGQFVPSQPTVLNTSHDALMLEYFIGSIRETNAEMETCLESAEQLCFAAKQLEHSIEKKRLNRENAQKVRLSQLIEAQRASSLNQDKTSQPINDSSAS